MRLREIGSKRQRLAERIDGGVPPPLAGQNQAEVVVVIGSRRIQLNRAIKQRQRLGGPFRLIAQYTQQLNRIGVVRMLRNDPPVMQFRLGKSTGLVMLDRLGEIGLQVGR